MGQSESRGTEPIDDMHAATTAAENASSAERQQKLMTKLTPSDLFPHTPFYHDGPNILGDLSLVRECKYALSPPPNCIVKVNGFAQAGLYLIKLPVTAIAGTSSAADGDTNNDGDAGSAPDAHHGVFIPGDDVTVPDSFFDSTIPLDVPASSVGGGGGAGGGNADAASTNKSRGSSNFSAATSASITPTSSSNGAVPSPATGTTEGGGPTISNITPETSKRFHWVFYNDSPCLRFEIKYYFPPRHGTIKAVGSVDVVLERDGWTRVSISLDPGDTARFSGAPMDCSVNGFVHDISAQPLPDSYNERAAQQHERRIAQHFGPGSTMSLVLDQLGVSVRVGAPVERQGSTTPWLLRWCVDKDVPFVDPIFRPNSASLGKVRQLPWKRPLEMNPKAGAPTVCAASYLKNRCIQPGTLGDSWLLCAISALTDSPKRIRAMFMGGVRERDVGAYALRINKDGWWRTVIVDDFLPALGYSPAYASINTRMPGSGNKDKCSCEVPHELWLGLIEKAFAKLMGGYSHIVYGDVLGALQDLTGFPTMNFECMGWTAIRKHQALQRRFEAASRRRRQWEQRVYKELTKQIQQRQAAIDRDVAGAAAANNMVFGSDSTRLRSASQREREVDEENDDGLYGAPRSEKEQKQSEQEERERKKALRQQQLEQEQKELKRKINNSPSLTATDNKKDNSCDCNDDDGFDCVADPTAPAPQRGGSDKTAAAAGGREPVSTSSSGLTGQSTSSSSPTLLTVGSRVVTAQELDLDEVVFRDGSPADIQEAIAKAAVKAAEMGNDKKAQEELAWLKSVDVKETQKKSDEAAASIFAVLEQHVMEQEHIVVMVTPSADEKRAQATFQVRDGSALATLYAEIGLTLGRAYVVSRVVHDRTSHIQLLELRDPWLVNDSSVQGTARGEGVVLWKGNWNYDSGLWAQHPSVARACDMLHLVSVDDLHPVCHKPPSKRDYDGRFWIAWSDVQKYFDGGGVCFAPRFDVGASPRNKKDAQARRALEAANPAASSSSSSSPSSSLPAPGRRLFGSASDGPWYDYRVRGDFLTARRAAASGKPNDFVFAGVPNVMLEIKNKSQHPIPMMLVLSQIDRNGLPKDHRLRNEGYLSISVCVGKLSKEEMLRHKSSEPDCGIEHMYLSRSSGAGDDDGGSDVKKDMASAVAAARAAAKLTHADIGARSVKAAAASSTGGDFGGESTTAAGGNSGRRGGKKQKKDMMDDPAQWTRGRLVELIGASGKNPTDGLSNAFHFGNSRDISVEWTLDAGDPEQTFVVIPRCTVTGISDNTKVPFVLGLISAVPMAGNFTVDFKRVHPHTELFWNNLPRFWYDVRRMEAPFQTPALHQAMTLHSTSRWSFGSEITDDSGETCVQMAEEEARLIERGAEVVAEQEKRNAQVEEEEEAKPDAKYC